MKRHIVELAISMFLAGLSLALLVQYYRGAWSDSNRAIVLSEVALLYFFVVLGIGYAIGRVQRL